MAPRLTRRGVVLVGVEATYGTPPALGANDGLLANEPEYTIDPTVIEREFSRDDLSPLPNIIGRKLAGMTFSTEVRGNGRQQGGALANVPLITRLFRACGFSLSLAAAPFVLGPYFNGKPGADVQWGTPGAVTNTDVVFYQFKVVTRGASGVAQVQVISDTAGEEGAAKSITSGQAFTFGTKGGSITPTFTDALEVGQSWWVWLCPPCARLDPVSTDFESITLSMNKDGLRHVLPGAFGTFQMTAEAGQIANIEWTFTGRFQKPTDAPFVRPTYEQTLPSQVELARLRVDGFPAIVNEYSYDQANDIQVRPDVSSSDGYIGIRVVNRDPTGGIDPEATLTADYDFWGNFADATVSPLQMRIGSKANNTVWMIHPGAQYTGLSYTDRNGIQTYDAGLRFARQKGNDETVILFC